ncbi:CAMK/CAMKL/MARK protein kinase, variant [Sphaeroforma arctica JP610]|uniref:CAMK/CAMKL/MARK protein kinase, variant n=1 Tax=Sphaeroforma arctica JP610 TaxID=667725 RepID=A0A0L0G2S3_9EUKA|nr:CAMK/CAMKL/MARK protein kinase, variant [Sphaeroforma arctica JP610]KNC83149.1 CAMK/CAMKL/MARK protein kinase, variant [Sphaeroforma arctica JP610]|eukprot:XP_014157051.1 CAMK/CAMKL/MARK protein kinase, variant [Sphaeroforma arctica JP610]
MPEVTQTNTRLQVDTRFSIGNYALGETLGKGVFSVVKESTHLITGQKVAVKVVDRTKVKEKDLKTLVREMQVMKLLTHNNIAKLYEIIDTAEAFYLVLELVQGDTMHAYLKENGTVTETLAADWTRQLASGVQYCHSRHVVHRDIKLNNIMVDPTGRVKLIDFGLSREFEAKKIETHCGTPVYAAPELFRSGGYFGPAVDMWAIGVVLHACVSGRLPFKGDNFRKRIQEGDYEVPKYFSVKLKNTIASLLEVNPKKRATATDLLKCPWIMQNEKTIAPIEVVPFEDAIDIDCVKAMRKLGFEEQEVLSSVQNDMYDHTAATYYLLKAHKGKDFDLEPLLVQLPPSAQSHSRPRQINSPGLVVVPPMGGSSSAQHSPVHSSSTTLSYPTATHKCTYTPSHSSQTRRGSSPAEPLTSASHSGQQHSPAKITSNLSAQNSRSKDSPPCSSSPSPSSGRRKSLAEVIMSPLSSFKSMKFGNSKDDVLNDPSLKITMPTAIPAATTTDTEQIFFPASPKPRRHL